MIHQWQIPTASVESKRRFNRTRLACTCCRASNCWSRCRLASVKRNSGGIPNRKGGWKMWARLDFEPMPCVYVCALRQADGEAHLKCKVEVALKQSQTFSEPPETSSEPRTGSRTSPEPALELPRTSQNQPGLCTGTWNLEPPETSQEPAPEAAPNFIWAETPKLKLLGIKLCPHAPTLLGIISMKSRSCNAKHVQYNVYIYICIYLFIYSCVNLFIHSIILYFVRSFVCFLCSFFGSWFFVLSFVRYFVLLSFILSWFHYVILSSFHSFIFHSFILS